MKIQDKGVLDSSYIDFTIPSEFAKKNLYYVTHYGYYRCDRHYSILRRYLNNFLFVYVCSGALTLEVKDKVFEIGEKQILLLDCRQPHHYYCRDHVEFLWFHFNGNNSVEYTQYLTEQKGIVFTEDFVAKLKPTFESILAGARAMIPNEHFISQCICTLFSRLAAPATSAVPSNHMLTPAITEITEHFDTDISLDDLAAKCNISTSHFIRSFKASIGYTPHEYLLAYRLRQSKQLLTHTAFSIEEIADQCGFHSASHFARAFRQSEGMSPTEFRTMKF